MEQQLDEVIAALARGVRMPCPRGAKPLAAARASSLLP
jgi:hypothetical protein